MRRDRKKEVVTILLTWLWGKKSFDDSAHSCALNLRQKFPQFLHPERELAALYDQLAVNVFGHLDKAVVVVEEVRLVTVGEYFRHGFPAAGEAAQHVLLPDVVAAVSHAVLDALQALLRAVQADIVETDGITPLPGFLRCKLCSAA